MTANEILALRPRIERFLRLFDECFVDDGTRHHLRVYVQGQLSNLPRKSVEPIAVAADMAPKTLQQFLSLAKWDHLLMRDRLQQRVASGHRGPRVIGVFDETGCPKKGDKTPGVQHQYCGATGKIDNGIVTVHLALAQGSFHCLLDSELFLPEVWSEDRTRCRAAGIPEALIHRPKWQIGLELYDIARGNGLAFAWVTFDEGYGGKPGFLRGLIGAGPTVRGRGPRIADGLDRAARGHQSALPQRGKGSPAQGPQAGFGPSAGVDPEGPSALRCPRSWPTLADLPRQRQRERADGLGGQAGHDDVQGRGRSAGMEPGIGHGPRRAGSGEGQVLREQRAGGDSHGPVASGGADPVACGACFEDGKSELGFDHWEGRSYLGLKRHQTVSAVSFLLLAEIAPGDWGGKAGDGRCAKFGRRRPRWWRGWGWGRGEPRNWPGVQSGRSIGARGERQST